MGVQIVGRQDHAINEVGNPIVFSTWAGDRGQTSDDRVSIGRDVWIGGSSVILSRVTIGEGSVIGSGSVVTQDIPAYSVAVGSPARVIKPRFVRPEDRERHHAALNELSAALSRGPR
jgi:acetyltransferase-like isoleucine patch superfamily enzyme